MSFEYSFACLFQDWLTDFSSQPVNASDSSKLRTSFSQLPWLTELLVDRLVDIRWGGWAMATVFASDPVAEDLVIQEFQHHPGGIWAACLNALLDVKECVLIRVQVGLFIPSTLKMKQERPVNLLKIYCL